MVLGDETFLPSFTASRDNAFSVRLYRAQCVLNGSDFSRSHDVDAKVRKNKRQERRRT